MAGKFKWELFKDINLSDNFFDPLKLDYPEFSDWFQKKADLGKKALVFKDDLGVGAFLFLKRENIDDDMSPLVIDGHTLPNIPRLKIGTLRLSEQIRKKRIGEGALGVALWYWKETSYDEIYVTVFEKQVELIKLFERFGFINIGKNNRGESVYMKNRKNIDYSDPYKSFPFINPNFNNAGLLPINDSFHDQLFPYSELANNKNEIAEITAGNGITKVFIASPSNKMKYFVGMPIAIYRIHTGSGQKAYKSAVTSFCTITQINEIKNNGKCIVTLDEFLQLVGNKSVFTQEQLKDEYNKKTNLIILELIYNGYFGKGKNVIYKNLKEAGLFDNYPYDICYTQEQFKTIIKMGDINVQNTFVD